MLFVLREYSHCSIANQLCILTLDALKTLFDVVDIVSMQKFVINEFSYRHQVLNNLIKHNQETGSNQIIKRY